MPRRIVSLSKEKLNKMISEAVKAVLCGNKKRKMWDISDIDVEILRSAYYDLRLVPTLTVFGDKLSNITAINENVDDILPPDDVVNNIIRKYGLPPQLVRKIEAYNEICVYVVTAVIGKNDKIIEQDMEKLGYFLGYRQPPQVISGMTFQVLQFEPNSEIQGDKTTTIKTLYKNVFHWTPTYSLPTIIKNGLSPSNKNKIFSYPPRVYLMRGDSTLKQMENLWQQLCSINTNPNNNGEYALLKIDIENLNDKVKFYYDSNSDIGLFTEQNIPKDRIEVIKICKFNPPKTI